MFTPRGGTNEFPKYRGKFFYALRDGHVHKIAQTPLHMWPDSIVLESTYDLGLKVGDAATLKQNLGAEGVDHIMSGWPQIVRAGANIVDEYELDPTASHGPDAWFIQRNPRTAIGCSEDGKTAFMVCVEGRLPNTYRPTAAKSRGLRLKGFAETLVRHGVHDAVNMDGGGSAFSWSLDHEVWGCYNTTETIQGQRRAHFSASVY
jgi:exopolysaccharide biosynthesis protein